MKTLMFLIVATFAFSALADQTTPVKKTTTTTTESSRSGALEEERMEDRDTDVPRPTVTEDKPIRKSTTTTKTKGETVE